jgi:hypothetical protein
MPARGPRARRTRTPPTTRSSKRLAEITGGDVYREGDPGAVTQDVHRLLGTGPTTVSTGERAQPVALAPYVAGVAFLPLTLLLWRRSR